MNVELGDDSTYLVRGLGSIFFHIPSRDVIFDDILFVPNLKKTLLSLSCMEDFQY